MSQPPTNSPSVASPALGAHVPIATSMPSSNAGSNTQKLKSLDIWSANEVNVLLDFYEDKWISLNRGNFKAKHRTELARDIQTRCVVAFIDTQVWNKWDNMKKTFIKEKQKEACFGAEPSLWEFYSQMEDLIGGTPKVSRLGDGFIGEYFVNLEVISLAEDEDMAAAEGKGGLLEAREGDVGVPGVIGIGDGVDEDTMPEAKEKAKVEEEKDSLLKGKGKGKKKNQEEVDAMPIKRVRQEETADSEAITRRKTKESAESSKNKNKPRQKLTIKDFSLGESPQPYDLVDDVSMQGPKITWPQLLYLSPKAQRQWTKRVSTRRVKTKAMGLISGRILNIVPVVDAYVKGQHTSNVYVDGGAQICVMRE
ncbi:hypothetical protein L7F22_022872 [Adiantum nelumboides]|nr:hypothetical protein [Adiantum nelumboides]